MLTHSERDSSVYFVHQPIREKKIRKCYVCVCLLILYTVFQPESLTIWKKNFGIINSVNDDSSQSLLCVSYVYAIHSCRYTMQYAAKSYLRKNICVRVCCSLGIHKQMNAVEMFICSFISLKITIAFGSIFMKELCSESQVRARERERERQRVEGWWGREKESNQNAKENKCHWNSFGKISLGNGFFFDLKSFFLVPTVCFFRVAGVNWCFCFTWSPRK